MANSANGSARPVEKENIPIAGTKRPCDKEPKSREPTIGPVQEKDTITSVRAIKKMPEKDFVLALLSVLEVQLLGSVISNAPRKERPKRMKMIKNTIFTIQLVAIKLGAFLPSKADITRPIRVKMAIIDTE